MDRFQVRFVSDFENRVEAAAPTFAEAMARARRLLPLNQTSAARVEIWDGGRRICGLGSDGLMVP
ncbi:MAG TPA: hypothetical protein VE990_12425 [Acidimicrobiales bacterium]|nr:hypothetical protein [Acidimicrobiales bacterium]